MSVDRTERLDALARLEHQDPPVNQDLQDLSLPRETAEKLDPLVSLVHQVHLDREDPQEPRDHRDQLVFQDLQERWVKQDPMERMVLRATPEHVDIQARLDQSEHQETKDARAGRAPVDLVVFPAILVPQETPDVLDPLAPLALKDPPDPQELLDWPEMEESVVRLDPPDVPVSLALLDCLVWMVPKEREDLLDSTVHLDLPDQ